MKRLAASLLAGIAIAFACDRVEARPAGQEHPAHLYLTALEVSGSEEWAAWFVRLTWCESRWMPGAVGALGERGLSQIRPEYHGPVPASVRGQVAKTYVLWEVHGPRIWSCA